MDQRVGGVNNSLPAAAAEARLSNLKAPTTSTSTTRDAPSLSVCPSLCLMLCRHPPLIYWRPHHPPPTHPPPLCTFRGAERLASQSQVGFLSTHGRQEGERIPFPVGGCFPSPERQVYPGVVLSRRWFLCQSLISGAH